MAGDPRYTSSQWRRMRPAIYERDGGICQMCAKPVEPKGYHVDHVVPVSEGGDFWSPANLRLTHAKCNLGRRNRRVVQTGAGTHVVLVYGPPGCGKSTHVDAKRGPGDVVVDIDRLAQALGSPDTHDHPDTIRIAATAARRGIVDKLERGELAPGTVWLISADPQAPTQFPADEVVRLHGTAADAERAGRPRQHIEHARRFEQAQPSRAW